MDWLRNWKRCSVVCDDRHAGSNNFCSKRAPKNVDDCSIMAWWGTLYPQFCFERGSQNSANYENTKTEAKDILLACESY